MALLTEVQKSNPNKYIRASETLMQLFELEDPLTTRAQYSIEGDLVTTVSGFPTTPTPLPVISATNIDDTFNNNKEEFSIVGSTPFNDRVTNLRDVSLSLTMYQPRGTDNQGLDPASTLLKKAARTENFEFFARILTYYGTDGTNFFWDVIAFNACASNLSRPKPGAGLIQQTVDVMSVGTVWFTEDYLSDPGDTSGNFRILPLDNNP
ncbi:UNVERIFIED_CONTAM: hypothetical protein BEN50_13690 [Euhalothece sp. KZN 001]